MTRTSVAVGAAVIAAVAMLAGCGKDGGPPAQTGTDITLKTNPDPVRTGENTFEVMVMQDGKPVTDATVSTEFYMAAMPAMNMPEMRTKTDLTHVANGMYRGNGQVAMAGKWDVTVMVMRGAQQIGSRKITVIAK
jgi:uncharacterized GH25 family protein